MIGIGYGEADHLSQYRALWPKDISPLADGAFNLKEERNL
jgi:hypothetical protein